MDPLSDVLSLLRVQTYWSGGFDYGGDWSFAFGPFEGIRFYAVISGDGWLAVDGECNVYSAIVMHGECNIYCESTAGPDKRSRAGMCWGY